MKRSLSTIIILAGISMVCAAQNFHGLYTDHRAMRVDDVLTILVVEAAKAGSQSGTNTSKANDLGVQAVQGSGLLSFIPALGASAGNKIGYNGKGGTTRQGSLDAKISARVVQVLDNGNLIIDGSKVVEINDEKEIIKISGVVRAADVGPNNTVYSYQIADAEITYSGRGTVNEGERPGLFARLFNFIF